MICYAFIKELLKTKHFKPALRLFCLVNT